MQSRSTRVSSELVSKRQTSSALAAYVLLVYVCDYNYTVYEMLLI